MPYVVEIEVDVFDPDALFQAARERLERDGAADPDDLLKDADGIQIDQCLIALFDPGVSPPGTDIQQSSVVCIELP